MKSKPLVMDHFSTVHTSYIIDFVFTNNVTILTGDSAVGKSAVYRFIRECMAIDSDILCLNYLDSRKDIKEIISLAKGKLVVIDNADILLNDNVRKYISLDNRNQYLLMGRNPKNLFTTKENLFELVSRKVGEQTEFSIVPYL